jgi:hypothetical protein
MSQQLLSGPLVSKAGPLVALRRTRSEIVLHGDSEGEQVPGV